MLKVYTVSKLRGTSTGGHSGFYLIKQEGVASILLLPLDHFHLYRHHRAAHGFQEVLLRRLLKVIPASVVGRVAMGSAIGSLAFAGKGTEV